MDGGRLQGTRSVKSGSVVFRDRPIRVARVIARLNIGGPAQHVTLLTAGLDRARFATTPITGVVGGREGDFTEAARARGVEPVVIPELGRAIRPTRDPVALCKLIRLFRRLRPDIVHTHTAKAGALGRLAARVAGVPVTVHTFHGHVLEGYFSPAATRTFLAIERWLARGTDRLVTVSPRLRAQLLAMGIGRPDQVEVVPLGLDLGRFRRGRGASAPALRASLGLAPGTPLLGSVGRLVPIKDHPTLFRAVAQLEAGGEAAHLVVVGDGDDRPALARLAHALGVSARVHFLGMARRPGDYLERTGRGNLFLAKRGNPRGPDRGHGGRCCGSVDRGGGRGGPSDPWRNGWLVPPGDPSAMAGAIRRLLAEPNLRARLAAAGRKVALDRHDVTRLVARIERLYTALINEKLTTDNGKPTK